MWDVGDYCLFLSGRLTANRREQANDVTHVGPRACQAQTLTGTGNDRPDLPSFRLWERAMPRLYERG